MERAQLDAQVLQADFAESLAKLMAINLRLSQQLGRQQNTISAQQKKLAGQNERLRRYTEALNDQQAELKDQGNKLSTLVQDFFELRRLTTNEARKLITIGNEVKGTKADLIVRFELSIQKVRDGQASFEASVNGLISKMLVQIEQASNESEAALARRAEEIEARLFVFGEQIRGVSDLVDMRLTAQENSIAKMDARFAQIFSEQATVLTAHVDETHALFQAFEQNLKSLLQRTMVRVWWGLAVAAFAMLIASGSVLMTHHLFG